MRGNSRQWHHHYLAVASCDTFGAMPFYLGIDGGGTKTKFLLGDEDRELAEVTGNGSNILRSGEEAVRSALLAGVDELCRRANVPPAEIQRVVAGVAGSANDHVRASLESILRQRIGGDIRIVGDMVIAHQAALEGAPGVLVNAGTGSIAYGCNTEGETARAGGWGFAISDEGSGHWIGRLAIAEAMRSFDAGKNQEFVHHLVQGLDFERPEEMARFANATVSPDFSRVFPSVLSLANGGDPVACEILRRAGEELARLADAVMTRLFAPFEGVRVAATGGVFRISDRVLESFGKALLLRHATATVSLATADPALGALTLARTKS